MSSKLKLLFSIRPTRKFKACKYFLLVMFFQYKGKYLKCSGSH